MKRIFLFSAFSHFLILALVAQVRVTVQAPSQTEEGQRIRVSYVVNTQEVEDIQVGEFPGFELLFGPSTSTSSRRAR